AAPFVPGHEAQAMTFFGSGACLLTAGLAGVWMWMRRPAHRMVATGPEALTRLGVRNAARHPVRSLLTVGLLASATFLVVAVESFHRETGATFFAREGGSGGFRLIAETDVPVFQTPSIAETKVVPFRVRPGDDASCLNLYQPLQPRILGVSDELIERGGFHFSAGLWTTPEEKANPWLLLQQKQRDGAVPRIAHANSPQRILQISPPP